MEYVFQVGGFSLRWYSTMVAAGFMVGAYIALIEARRLQEDTNHVYNILLLALPLALIGARIYHVVDEWNDIYSNDLTRIIRIDEGGIGIYGAIAGSILAVYIYTKWKKLDLWRWLDIGAPGLIMGQAIGRWGNFFNEELYGTPSNLPWAISIPPDKRILGYEGFNQFHPLFLYESLLNLMAVGALLYIGRKYAGRLKTGDIALLYGVFYGAIRLGLENLRIGNWTIGGGLPTATVFSIAAVVGCGGALVYRHWWVPRAAARKAARP